MATEMSGAASSIEMEPFPVLSQDLRDRTVAPNDTLIEPEDAVGETLHMVQLMGDHEESFALRLELFHFAETFLLEAFIADCQTFINQQ